MDSGAIRRSELCEVEATALVYGGSAMGRHPDGTVFFVPYALPGERLRVRILERRPGYLRTELIEVLQASPERQVPRCRHFGRCGGCHYQHMPYSRQLELKRDIVGEQLRRIGGVADPPVEPVRDCRSPWAYRNHLQFHVGRDGRLGFQAARSHRLVPVTECYLPEEGLGALWPGLSPLLPVAGPGRLVLRIDAQGRRLALLETPGRRDPDAGFAARLVNLVPALRDCSVWWHRAPSGRGASAGLLRRLWGEEALEMSVLGERFRLSPLSFFQVNVRGAEVLVQLVLEFCGGEQRRHILDLYCGVGLFSRFLAPRAPRLTAAELSISAAADFRANCGGLPGVRLLEADAASALSTLEEPPDLIVADPPRAGLGPEVIRGLSRSGARDLVYVSCDPATLARDAALLQHRGWSLRRLVPVDLFPQTAHIESVSLWNAPTRA